MVFFFFFFKQKTAYEIVSRDWSSDVCSSDLSMELPGSLTMISLTVVSKLVLPVLQNWVVAVFGASSFTPNLNIN